MNRWVRMVMLSMLFAVFFHSPWISAKEVTATAVPAAPNLSVNIGNSGLDAASNVFWNVFVKNDGNAAASDFVVRATLPEEVDFDHVEENTLGVCAEGMNTGQKQTVDCTVSALAAGENHRVRIIARLHRNVRSGAQALLTVVVDVNHNVAEQNEDDNMASMVVALEPLCDLVVASVKLKPGYTASLEDGASPPGTARVLFLDIFVKNNGVGLCRQDPAALKIVWPEGTVANICPDNKTYDPQEHACVAGRLNGCFDTCQAVGVSHISAGDFALVATATAFMRGSSSTYDFPVTITVDATEKVPETNEQNNTSTLNARFP